MQPLRISDDEVETHERERLWVQFCQIVTHQGKKRILKNEDSLGPFELLNEVLEEVMERYASAGGKTSWS